MRRIGHLTLSFAFGLSGLQSPAHSQLLPRALGTGATAAPETEAYPDPDAIAPARPNTVPREVGTVSPHRRFALTVGGGKLLTLPQPASSVFVADSAIADVQPPSPRGVFVFGKKPGTTTLFALDHDGKPILAYNLTVEYDETALQEEITRDAPGLDVRLERMLHGVRLVGSVPDAMTAARIQAIAERLVGQNETVLNQLSVGTSTQVNLRVRVAEVSRSVARNLGFNWAASFRAGSFQIGLNTGSGTVLSGVTGTLNGLGSGADGVDNIVGSVGSRAANGTLTLDAMAEEGLVTLLAEPNLTTTSGEPATFQAGGQFPIPVPQGLGSVGIEYKDYGVSVGFTPTVLSNGMISMKVNPEVSSLSLQGQYALANGGGNVPALVTRRAETTVELASGQSFAIGGLIQNDTSNNVTKIPGLGDIPILGVLFRSTQFQRNETELVIVVTAYVVHPTDMLPTLPTDLIRHSTDLERLFLDRSLMRASIPPVRPEHPLHLYGPAGFLFD